MKKYNKLGISLFTIVIFFVIVAITGITSVFVINELKSDDNNTNNDLNETTNKNESDGFLLYIEDVFDIDGVGIVVTGKVRRGTIRVGDEVEILGMGLKTIKQKVESIEALRKKIPSASAGDNIGIVLGESLSREDLCRGQALSTPGTMTLHNKFSAEIEVVKSSKRNESNYISNEETMTIFLNNGCIDGKVNIDSGKATINEGDIEKVTVSLDNSVAIEVDQKVEIRRNNTTIATGKITKIY